MSYAAAASKNRLPPDQQPHPDQSLLEGSHGSDSDDLSHSGSVEEKVHVVERAEFEHDRHAVDEPPHPAHLSADDAPSRAPAPRTVPQAQTRQHGYPVSAQAQSDAKDAVDTASKQANKAANNASQDVDAAADKAKRETSKAADNASKQAEQAKDTASKEYDQAKKTAGRKYEKAKSTANEYGRVAERKFEAGKEEAKKEYDNLSEKAKASYNKLSREAQDDWHKLSKESKKQWEAAKNSEVGQELQKPEVWGSMLAVTNLAVVGGLAYFTFMNWSKPRWDRRVVTGTVIAASAWFGLQGYILPQTDAVQQRRR